MSQISSYLHSFYSQYPAWTIYLERLKALSSLDRLELKLGELRFLSSLPPSSESWPPLDLSPLDSLIQNEINFKQIRVLAPPKGNPRDGFVYPIENLLLMGHSVIRVHLGRGYALKEDARPNLQSDQIVLSKQLTLYFHSQLAWKEQAQIWTYLRNTMAKLAYKDKTLENGTWAHALLNMLQNLDETEAYEEYQNQIYADIYRQLEHHTQKTLRLHSYPWLDLEKAFQTLAQSQNITQLSLGQAFQELPDLSIFPNLRELYIRKAKLRRLDPQKLPSGLENLEIIQSEVQECAPGWARLANLRKINLSHNRLEALALDFFHIPLLQRLNLSFNNFRRLPRGLAQFSQVRNLDLSHNQIQPSGLDLSFIPSHCRVDLQHNPFSFGNETLKKTLEKQYPNIQI